MGHHRTEVPLLVALGLGLLVGCSPSSDPVVDSKPEPAAAKVASVAPRIVTEAVPEDSDDPAIWIHPEDPSQSLVLGTDKGGGVYAFDLEGRILPDRSVTGLGRMNNVDVEYGLELGGERVDIAVATERSAHRARIWRLPEMEEIDGGGIEIFAGETGEAYLPMGVALYRRPADGEIFAIFSRKTGPSGSYLWQYRLQDDGSGSVGLTKVRELGEFSGIGEIEAIAVDDATGYLYYSDEAFGVRKYSADPDAEDADRELGTFGTDGFAEDREGISIYPSVDAQGYILVSDQQARSFRFFRREGTADDPHHHELIGVVPVEANESDGSDVTPNDFGGKFPGGLFVAMSDDRTFHYYAWEDLTAGRQQEPRGGLPDDSER